MSDLSDQLQDWLAGYVEDEDTTTVLAAGVCIGLAFAVQYPAIAKEAHEKLTAEYKIRDAGSLVLFDAIRTAAGEHRTTPEQMADELAVLLAPA